MTHDPLPPVSVVIVTHQRPELLRAALGAALAQRYAGPIEVLVVFDRAEPDASLSRDGEDRRVRVFANTRTPGLAGARNTGVLAATGELVAFCDDDDVWLPERLARQVAALATRPDRCVAVTGVIISSGGRATVRVPPVDELPQAALLRSRVAAAHPSTVLVRREAMIGRIGMVDEAIPGGYGEDYEWMLRATAAAPALVVRLPLVRVRWGASSFFQDRWEMIADAIEYLVEKHPELRTDRRGLARLHGRRAFALAAGGHRSEGARLALTSLRLEWRDRRPYLALLVATGIVDAGRLMRLANRFGAGIV